MEKVIEKYKKLVEIRISHQGFKQEFDDVSSWLSIRSNADSQVIMRKNKMIFRETKFGFFILIQTKNSVGDEKKALFSIKDLSLIFDLEFTNHAIASKTALPLKNTKKYLFSNDKAGLTAPNLALSPPIFNNAIKYQAGEIVKEGAIHKLAIFDYTKPPDQDRIKFVNIASWNAYVTTENLDNINVEQGFGQIKILINDSLSAGLRLLSNTEELESPTFEIRFLNI